MSNDFTGGYGPEEFLIKNAIKGKYIIQANYYGSTAQRITGPTTIYLELYTNYGKKNQKKNVVTMRLSNNKEVIAAAYIEEIIICFNFSPTFLYAFSIKSLFLSDCFLLLGKSSELLTSSISINLSSNFVVI